jgi:hypothetical protein
LLALSTTDMLKMKLEFPQAFIEIVESGKQSLKKELMLKLHVIRKEEVEEEKNTEMPRNHIRTAFAVKILEALEKNMRRKSGGQVKSKKTKVYDAKKTTNEVATEDPSPMGNEPAKQPLNSYPTIMGELILKLKKVKEEGIHPPKKDNQRGGSPQLIKK